MRDETDCLQVNRNKKSIGLSFQHEEGVKILHDLVKSSDVLVENYIPGMWQIADQKLN